MKWLKASLLDICNPKQWPTISSKELTSSGYPVYGANGQIGYYHSYNHEEPTILVTCRGATCGTLNISPPKSYTTGNAMALDDIRSDLVDFKFLYYSLLSRGLKDTITGAAQPQITRKNLSIVNLSIPSLSEQKQIVKILDRADELRKQRAEADALSERILPALFIKMFGDPVNWDVEQTEPLGKLVNIQSGGTPSKKNPNYWDGDIPWVSAKDMKKDIIYESMDHLTDLAIKETNVKYVEAGSILMVVRGMILAHTIPIALAGTRLTINQDMKALMPNCNKINSSYLHATLKALNKVILSQVGTAGHGTRKFDTEYLLKLPIFIPSQENLKKFDLVSLESQKIISQISQARSKLDNLFQTLVHRAFSGDLTAQWREAHMTELLQEMEYQTKALNLQPTLF